MHDAIKVLFVVVSALFPIVDPLSASPIFLALTSNIMPATRRKLSWQVTLNSFILLVGSYFMGSHVLDFVGVSLPAVQVGGGFVVVAVGWRLLMEKEGEASGIRREVQSKDIMGRAFYPLTLPLTVGPGSISVAVTVGANSTQLWNSLPNYPRGANCHGLGGRQHFSVLRLRGLVGKSAWRNRNGCRHSTFVVSPCMHWRSDCVEWD
jgi:MarC family membrane protein